MAGHIRIKKRIGTGFLVGAWVLAALNLIPFNYAMSFAGCIMWCWAAIETKDTEILILDSTIAVLAFIAILNHQGVFS